MQKTAMKSCHFGDDIMSLEGSIKWVWQKAQSDRKEIWDSLQKDGRESAVRVEVFSHLNKIEHVTVSERREGRLFKTEFNSLLEPVAAASNHQIAEEHVRKIAGFINQREGGKREFFKHMMDSEETTRVQGRDEYMQILLSKKIVSKLQLEKKMSCKWTREGDALVMTPLKETSISTRIILVPYSGSLVLVIPEEMRLASGLKRGDYVEWREEEGQLSLRKAGGKGQDSRKIYWVGVSLGTSIPKAIAEELKVEKGMYGVWTFGEDEEGGRRLWLELMRENPNITTISASEIEYVEQFRVSIPKDIGLLKKGEEAVLEVKEGKLYMRRK